MRLKKRLKSFSLIETMATLTIYAFLLLMITNIVLSTARTSQQLKMRSRIRSELTETVALFKRDVRNVASVDTSLATNCQGTGTTAKCTLNLLGDNIIWTIVGNKITRTDTNHPEKTYTTSDFIKIDSLAFTITPDASSAGVRAVIILTIKAEGSNPIWKVNNQVMQEVISTRNYDISP